MCVPKRKCYDESSAFFSFGFAVTGLKGDGSSFLNDSKTIDSLSDDGQTALDIAEADDIRKLLLEAGAYVSPFLCTKHISLSVCWSSSSFNHLFSFSLSAHLLCPGAHACNGSGNVWRCCLELLSALQWRHPSHTLPLGRKHRKEELATVVGLSKWARAHL